MPIRAYRFEAFTLKAEIFQRQTHMLNRTYCGHVWEREWIAITLVYIVRSGFYYALCVTLLHFIRFICLTQSKLYDIINWICVGLIWFALSWFDYAYVRYTLTNGHSCSHHKLSSSVELLIGFRAFLCRFSIPSYHFQFWFDTRNLWRLIYAPYTNQWMLTRSRISGCFHQPFVIIANHYWNTNVLVNAMKWNRLTDERSRTTKNWNGKKGEEKRGTCDWIWDWNK